MINMNKYIDKIANEDTKKKVNNNITQSTIIFYVYVLIALFSAIMIILGCGIYTINKNINGAYYYIIGIVCMVLDLAMLVIFDSIDPLKDFILNDKILIYLRILKDQLNLYKPQKIKIIKIVKDQKIHFTTVKLNRQLYKLKENIENTFIYRDNMYKNYINEINDIISMLKNVRKINDDYSEICNVIEQIINAYEFSIISEFIDEECKINYITIRNERIKDLNKDIVNILDNTLNKSECNQNKFNDISFKFRKNFVNVSIMLVIASIIIILIFVKGLSDTQKIIAIVGGFITINTWIVKIKN